MILSSTVRQLAAKGATIYRVDYSAFVAPTGHSIGARVEYFATKGQAQKAIENWAIPGLPSASMHPGLPLWQFLVFAGLKGRGLK